MPSIVLNARFLTRPPTGVDRVASELTAALSDLLQETGNGSLQMALPRTGGGGTGWPGSLRRLPQRRAVWGRGHLWEQCVLPAGLGSSWLINLCNTGPALRRKQVVMIHDAQIYTQPGTYSLAFRLFYRMLLPVLARRSRVVLTVSEYSRRGLEKHGVVPPGKAHVIHNGVDHFGQVEADTTVLARHGLAQQGYFLAIGSLAPHKNLKMLVNAARARKDKTTPLIIAGGKNLSVFKDEGLQDGDGVRFLGRVSDEELKALYQSASALLFPSVTEGFGLPPLEAMSCGCPVVATTGGAVPEVCGDAVLYADPFRQSEWTGAMEKVAASPDLRQDLSQRGLARAQLFTWRRAAEQLLRILAD